MFEITAITVRTLYSSCLNFSTAPSFYVTLSIVSESLYSSSPHPFWLWLLQLPLTSSPPSCFLSFFPPLIHSTHSTCFPSSKTYQDFPLFSASLLNFSAKLKKKFKLSDQFHVPLTPLQPLATVLGVFLESLQCLQSFWTYSFYLALTVLSQ